VAPRRSILNQRFGANLRRVRRMMGMSQEQFAEMLGVHRTYAAALERGERNSSLETIEHISQQLGMDPVAMLTALDEAAPPAQLARTPRRRGPGGERRTG